MNNLTILFPGQGSQYVGMGKNLYDNFSTVKRVFEEANDILGFDIKEICFNSSLKELSQTKNAQPALVTVSVAAFRTFIEEVGVWPKFMAGHSLGEYSALTCANAIEFSDALKLTKFRGEVMQEAAMLEEGTMLSIEGLDKRLIELMCNEYNSSNCNITVSNYNAPTQTVISGSKKQMEKIGEELKKMGARVIPLKVNAAFHCHLMESASKKMNDELKKYQYKELKSCVLSNVNALPYESTNKIVDALTMQMVSPVQWKGIVDYLKSNNANVAIEMGPRTVLKNLMKKNNFMIDVFSCENADNLQILKEYFSQNKKSEQERENLILKVINKCLAISVCTKNRNLVYEEYKDGVIIPVKKIKSIKEQIEEGKIKALEENAIQSIQSVRTIFDTKKTSISEQIERFNEIILEINLNEDIDNIKTEIELTINDLLKENRGERNETT